MIGISERFNLSAAGFLLVGGLLVLTGFFYLIVFTFACLGQRLGQAFGRFPPLVAYSINVGASLLGILLFSAVSFLSWRPDAWLLLGVAAALFFGSSGQHVGKPSILTARKVHRVRIVQTFHWLKNRLEKSGDGAG